MFILLEAAVICACEMGLSFLDCAIGSTVATGTPINFFMSLVMIGEVTTVVVATGLLIPTNFLISCVIMAPECLIVDAALFPELNNADDVTAVCDALFAACEVKPNNGKPTFGTPCEVIFLA